eukprot:7757828-Heterocapsa_arctica.AAC.1
MSGPTVSMMVEPKSLLLEQVVIRPQTVEEGLVADVCGVVGVPDEVGYEVYADMVNLVRPSVDAGCRVASREDGTGNLV